MSKLPDMSKFSCEPCSEAEWLAMCHEDSPHSDGATVACRSYRSGHPTHEQSLRIERAGNPKGIDQ